MNRYTYKAKRKDNGELVYGNLIYNADDDKYFIDYSIVEDYESEKEFDKYNCGLKIYATEIDSETICQCTGLQDTEGNYIFENDIVNIYFKKTNILNAIAEVIYKDYSFKLETPGYILADHNWEEDLKIIGNKFDEVK